VANTTISGNSAGFSGGGIATSGSVRTPVTVTVENSIVAGNTVGGTASDLQPGPGPLTLRYSLIGDNTGTGLAEAPVGMSDVNGNLIGGPTDGIIDPLLAPLADNGGPTQTHALMAGSPAINAGDPAAMAGLGDVPLFDQRGAPFVRVFDARIDIGAHERQGPTVEIVEVATPTIVPVDEVTIQFSSEVTGFDTGDLELSLNGGANLMTDSQTLATSDNRTYVLGGMADVTTGSGYYTLTLVSAGSDIVNTSGGLLEVGDTISWVMGRVVLGLTVDTLIDEADGNIDDGDVSLRDAMAAAAPGETIDFDASLDGGTVLLTLGELAITRPLAIDASALTGDLTIDASGNDPTPDQDNGDGSRVFNIDDGNGNRVLEVAIRGVTLTGGDVSGEGGAILARENLMVANSTITGNSASGGAGVRAFREVTVIDSTISGNSATKSGGGISGSTVTVTDSTISGNSARGSGGGISGSAVTVTNSTISGNSADDNAGGILGGSLTVTNSTISGNSAKRSDGGISAGSGLVSIDTSIVAGNSDDGSAPDLRRGTGRLTVRYSLIGDNTRTGLAEAPVGMPDVNGNLIGGPTDGIIDPLLAPLADNGGPTETYALMVGSPAINAGDPAAMAGVGDVPLFDQRGAPFGRVAGGRIDMGAHERQDLTVGIVEVASPMIVPVDEVTIEFSSQVTGFDTGDLELSLNGGPNLLTASQTLTTTDNQTFVLGGLADVTTGSRFYTLRLVSAGSEIVDTSGDPLDAGDTINWFMGPLVLGLTVNTFIDEADGNIDDGDVSLRDALAAAVPDETIDFDASLDGGTILLTMGELAVTKALIIDATMLPSGLTIDASSNDPTPAEDNGDGNRVFRIDDGDNKTDSPVTISGLTLTGGDVSGGGGALFTRENLEVTKSTISGNSATRNGGGISGSTVTVTDSTISNNLATGDSDYGGGISGDFVTIISSTISGNSASSNGGGISGGTVAVTDSTISDNSASGGGGIWGDAVTVTDSTISGNSATRNGGGISARDVTVTNSVISGNSASGSSGGIYARGDVTVTNSTISGNSASTGGGISALGDVTVTSSTISGNSSVGPGGGIYARGPMTVIMVIIDSIVAGNTDDGRAPDLHRGRDSLAVRHSLIGNNTGGGLAEAPIGMPDVNGNLIGGRHGTIDPLLAPLADNGGPTMTHALLAFSPAVNAGDPTFTSPPNFDQRGAPFDRVFGGRIDMGAYELQCVLSASLHELVEGGVVTSGGSS